MCVPETTRGQCGRGEGTGVGGSCRKTQADAVPSWVSRPKVAACKNDSDREEQDTIGLSSHFEAVV